MLALVEEAGLSDRIEVDSAGTNAFRVGGAPDSRSAEVAQQRGIELSSRCRQFEVEDFSHFDYVIAMDRRNAVDPHDQAPDAQAAAKIALMRSFDPGLNASADGDGDGDGDEVPDPYIGARGFDRVFDICDAGCRGLLDYLCEEHELAGSGGSSSGCS